MSALITLSNCPLGSAKKREELASQPLSDSAYGDIVQAGHFEKSLIVFLAQGPHWLWFLSVKTVRMVLIFLNRQRS